MTHVWEAVKEDIVMAAGGPMGSSRAIEVWSALFKTSDVAISYCENDYKQKIKWLRNANSVRSPDLGQYQYTITKRRVF
jgi:hypothetical protein